MAMWHILIDSGDIFFINGYQDSVTYSGEFISSTEFKLSTRKILVKVGIFKHPKITKDLRTGIIIYIRFSLGAL